MTGIQDNVPDQIFQEKLVNILNEISFDVSEKDMEAFHRADVSKNN